MAGAQEITGACAGAGAGSSTEAYRGSRTYAADVKTHMSSDKPTATDAYANRCEHTPRTKLEIMRSVA